MHMHEQWWLHCASQRRQWMPLSEHMYCVAVAFNMTEWVEQWICIKFCLQIQHFSVQTIWMIKKAFRHGAMSTAQVKMWHKCFKDDWESFESDPCSGRSITSKTPENVDHVWAAINKDCQLTVWELEVDLGIPKTTVSEILTQDYGIKRVIAKFIPQLLLPEHHAAVANDTERTVWGPKVPTWRGPRHHCPMYNISCICIFFNKCLCFS